LIIVSDEHVASVSSDAASGAAPDKIATNEIGIPRSPREYPTNHLEAGHFKFYRVLMTPRRISSPELSSRRNISGMFPYGS
jgi:hypothetical protein